MSKLKEVPQHGQKMVETSTLVGQYADLINQHGVNSVQAKAFLDAYAGNEEFLRLARLAGFLRTRLDTYQAVGSGGEQESGAAK